MNTPIWWCIVKQEPIGGGQMSCYRIIKAIACEAKDIGDLWDQHATMFTMTTGYLPMYFHRDPTESPLLEASRRPDHSSFGVDTMHDNWPEKTEYKDW